MQRIVLYYQCAMAALVISAALLLSACSETTVVEEEEEDDIIVLVPEPEPAPEPEPDWADNEMTITVRANKTGEELLHELRLGAFAIGWDFPNRIGKSKPEHYNTGEPYTATVSVVTMQEIGFGDRESVPTQEVRERLKELGYDLFTFQEGIELRLWLHDQPDVSTDHLWSAFFVLPEKDSDFPPNGQNSVLSMYHYKTDWRGRQGRVLILDAMFDFHFVPDADDPHYIQTFAREHDVLWGEKKYGTRFAVITSRQYD